MRRPISIAQAAEILGISKQAVRQRIAKGQLLAYPFADKGWMVCHEAILGRFDETVDEKAFREACKQYITVAEACEIVCVTDAMIGRMLADGTLDGFRLNKNAWAVSRESCESNLRDYVASPPKAGRPRSLPFFVFPRPSAERKKLEKEGHTEQFLRSLKSQRRGKKSRRPKRP